MLDQNNCRFLLILYLDLGYFILSRSGRLYWTRTYRDRIVFNPNIHGSTVVAVPDFGGLRVSLRGGLTDLAKRYEKIHEESHKKDMLAYATNLGGLKTALDGQLLPFNEQQVFLSELNAYANNINAMINDFNNYVGKDLKTYWSFHEKAY